MKIILSGNPISTQTIYQYACRGKFGVFYMTKRGKDLKEQYQWEAKKQWKENIITGDCRVEVDLYFKDKRRRDIDNFEKLLLDSLQGIVYEDDKQVFRKTTEKYYQSNNPRIEIKIIKYKRKICTN